MSTPAANKPIRARRELSEPEAWLIALALACIASVLIALVIANYAVATMDHCKVTTVTQGPTQTITKVCTH